MKITFNPRLQGDPNLIDTVRRIAVQLNLLSEGFVSGRYTALTAPPTTGRHAQGDEVSNSAPVELGAPGARYVVTGWVCVADGSPGTWLQKRCLTGN